MNTRSIMGPLGVSIAAILVTVIALGSQLPAMVAAVTVRGVDDEVATTRITELVSRHESEAAVFKYRWIGRAAYFNPDPPPPPRVTPAMADAPRAPDPRTDPAPPNYAGPLTNPNCILGNEVWFTRGSEKLVLKMGETVQGVRLVEVNPPYSARVAWTAPAQGHISFEEGMYDLSVFPKFAMGPGTPFLLTPSEAPIRIEGLESAPNSLGPANSAEGPGAPTQRPSIRRPGDTGRGPGPGQVPKRDDRGSQAEEDN